MYQDFNFSSIQYDFKEYNFSISQSFICFKMYACVNVYVCLRVIGTLILVTAEISCVASPLGWRYRCCKLPDLDAGNGAQVL